MVKPGEPVEFEPATDLKVTNISLGVEIAEPIGRTSVRLVYGAPKAPEDGDELSEDEDEPPALEPVATILCSLTPGIVSLRDWSCYR